MMKKSLAVVLSMMFVLAIASIAYAAPPTSWNPPGPTYHEPDNGTNYSSDTPKHTPHGSYVATGDECEICHSPHQAGSGGVSYKLLHAATRDAACDYCHVGAAAKTNKKVYDGGKTGQNGHEIKTIEPGGTPDAPPSINIGTSLDCFDCHAPHGAKALPTKILKSDPANDNDPVTGVDPKGLVVVDETTFCADCHYKNYNKVDNYSLYDHLGISHPMGPGGDHSAAGSRYCDSCHSASRGGLYPHISTGDALLVNGTKREQMDKSCYGGCHGLTGVDYQKSSSC